MNMYTILGSYKLVASDITQKSVLLRMSEYRQWRLIGVTYHSSVPTGYEIDKLPLVLTTILYTIILYINIHSLSTIHLFTQLNNG